MRRAPPARWRSRAAAAGLVLFALLTFSAARFGWGVGGLAPAVAAVGFVGLFTVPLIVGE